MQEGAGTQAGTAVRLRPAVPEDDGFFAIVYAGTRAEELAMVPWTDEQKAAFCRMQFQAQTAHYRQHHPNAEVSVIEVNGDPAGRLYVDRSGDEIEVVDISILPKLRGNGVGTRLLQELQAEAAATGRRLSIYVEQFNPARRLYDRLGFEEREQKGVHWLMKWQAEAKRPGTASE